MIGLHSTYAYTRIAINMPHMHNVAHAYACMHAYLWTLKHVHAVLCLCCNYYCKFILRHLADSQVERYYKSIDECVLNRQLFHSGRASLKP